MSAENTKLFSLHPGLKLVDIPNKGKGKY